MKLNLLVIRTPDIKKLAEFYSILGPQFEFHKHGNSPYHYSAKIADTVLEIYPLAKGQTEADKHLRLGFTIDNFDGTLLELSKLGVVLNEPKQTDFGLMALIEDPDGRKVELYGN